MPGPVDVLLKGSLALLLPAALPAQPGVVDAEWLMRISGHSAGLRIGRVADHDD